MKVSIYISNICLKESFDRGFFSKIPAMNEYINQQDFPWALGVCPTGTVLSKPGKRLLPFLGFLRLIDCYLEWDRASDNDWGRLE